jgi:hypothetical protein
MNISRKFDKVTIEPAELPDLTPLDFFWRGHATNRAYVKSQNCIPLIYYYLKVYGEDFEPLHILFYTKYLKTWYLIKYKLFVYQGQKVHLFRPSPSLLAEAQPRLENSREQRALFGSGAH